MMDNVFGIPEGDEKKAVMALFSWFESQGMSPVDAILVMSYAFCSMAEIMGKEKIINAINITIDVIEKKKTVQ